MTDLAPIISEIEALTEPSREVDAMIAIATDDPQVKGGTHVGGGAFSFNIGTYIATPAYTASVDAALALAERVLPGMEYELSTLYGVARASLPLNSQDENYSLGERRDGSMPIAICIAVLRAFAATVRDNTDARL